MGTEEFIISLTQILNDEKGNPNSTVEIFSTKVGTLIATFMGEGSGVPGPPGPIGPIGPIGPEGPAATNNTLELVRAENPTIEGNIDANGNQIDNLANASNSQQAATLAQLDAVLLEAKTYAESLSVSAIKMLGDYDLITLALYPTAPLGSGTGGAIRRNDAFRVWPIGGTFHGIEYEAGDILYAIQSTPGQVDSNWASYDYNKQQATETDNGTLKIVSAAEASDENTLEDTKAVTAKKAWLNIIPRLKQLANTWAAKQTFTTAPRLSSTTANHYVKVDVNKDITSIEKIPTSDILSLDRHLSDNLLERLVDKQLSYFLPTQGVSTFTNTMRTSTISLSGNSAVSGGQVAAIKFSTTAVAGTFGFQRGQAMIIRCTLDTYLNIKRKFKILTNVSGTRFFCGITNSYTLSAPTNIEPTAMVNCIGICKLSTSENLHVIHNDGSGTATTIDLGSDFIANSTADYWYSMCIYKESGSADITIRVIRTDAVGGKLVSDTVINNNYVDAAHAPAMWITNNATAAIAEYWDYGCGADKSLYF